MDWKIRDVLRITLILGFLLDSVVKGSIVYVSNSTGIIKFDTDTKESQLVVSQPKGRIIGVAIDISDGLLFWSDVSSEYKAIYRSALDGTSSRIIVQDVLQCNGLTTDWISNHIYWTDAESQTVEIANYDGTGRRIMFSLSGRYLAEPRGIVVDPIYGYLFWASQMSDNTESRRTDTQRDQDTNGQIERSRLDGSDHEVIVNTKVFWPNQLAISRLFGKLYWVEASPTSGIMSCKFDGSSYKKERDLFGISSGNPSFGLAITGNKVIVSTWLTNALYSTLVETSNAIWIKETEKLGKEELFSMVIGDVSSQESKSGDHPCGREDKGGCSHLCLPSGWGNDYTCVCPSYSGLTIGQDGKTCIDIKDLLFFTSQGSGEVSLISIAKSTSTLSSNLAGRSDAPHGVVYEPENKVMIWSDTDQHTIYITKLGKEKEFKEVLMNSDDGIGIIEDMAIDIFGGRLYFINSGVIFGSQDPSSKWYRIEMVSLNRMVRRTLVTTVDQLTSIALDTNKGVLYFGSCGRQSQIYFVLFDGLEILQIESNFSLNCASDMTFWKEQLYIVDKADVDEEETEMNRIMSYNTNDKTWNILMKIKDIPYHMAVTDSHLYYCLSTDEGQGQIISFDFESHDRWVFFTAPYKVTGLFYSTSDLSVPFDLNPCLDSPCSDGCVRVTSPSAIDQSQYRCTCPDATVSMLSADGIHCKGPENFVLLADLNTIKQVNLDTGTEDRVQTVYYASSQSNIHSLYYENVTNTLYWTDQTRSSILSMVISPGSDLTPIEIYNGGNMLVLGLTLDVEKQKLFWAVVDSDRQGYIMRLKLSHSHKAKRIIFTDAVPRCVILSPDNRWLYWTEYNDDDNDQGGDNSRPSVHKAHQNGNHHNILLEDKLTWPNSLSIYENRVYIADGIGKIWSMNLEGSDVKEMYFLTGTISHVFDVKIIDNVLFYSDWSTHTVNMVDMVTGQQDVLASNLTRPTSLVVYQGSKKEDWNLCNTNMNRCSHSCVPVPKTVHCSCPEGYYLQEDQITCVQGESPWIYTRSSHCSTDCGQNAQCSQLLSTLSFQCVCLPGYHGNGTFCEACPVDFYKQHLDNTTCLPCPVSMTTNGKTASLNCSCRSSNAVLINGTCTEVTMVTTEVTPEEPPVVKVQILATEKSIESVKLNVQSTPSSKKDDKNNEILNDRKWREPTDVGYNVPQPVLRPYFDHCPHGQTITLYIPAYKNKVTLNVTWHALDITGQKLQIKSNFVITNGIITFEWWANGEEGKQRVMMEATDKWGHTVTCQFYVKILDLEPPIFTYCPHDISVQSNKGVERVLWSKPEVIDNVKVKTFTGTHNTGDEFVEGITMVNYTATDQAGNTAYCNFSVNLHKVDNSCDLPNIKNGEFSCTPVDLGDKKIEERCEILCNKGFVVNPLPDFSDVYKCMKEQKEIQHLKDLMSTLQPCLKYKMASVVTQEFSIRFEGPCVANDIQLRRDLSLAIIEHLEVREICPKSKCVYSNITIDCDADGEDSISKRSASENTVFLIQWNVTIDNSTGFTSGQVESILMTIRLELMKHLPGLNLRINEHDYATFGELKTSNLILGCQVGEVLHKLGCVSCPPGTRYAIQTGACEICNNGSYQPYDGQTDCLPCESDQTSQQGSISQEQCITVSSLNEMSKFLIITACTFGFVFLCMAIFMYLQFKRQQKRTQKRMSPSNGHKYITPNIFVASSTLPKGSRRPQKSDFKIEGQDCHLYGNHDYEEPGFSYNTNLSTRTTLSGRTVYQNDLSHAPSPAGSPRSLRSTQRSLGSPVSERSFYTGDFRNFSPTLRSNTLQSQNRRPNLLLYDK